MKNIIFFLIAIMVLSAQPNVPQSNNFELFYTGFTGPVTAIAEDTSSNIWAAIYSVWDQDSINEVILINDQIIDTIFVHSAYQIWGLEVDINNVLWIATQDTGLAKFNGSELTYIDVSEIITLRDRNNVTCIEFDNENNMWIGAFNGIAKFDGNNWTVYDETNSPLQYIPDITTMSFDTSNNLWFGHYYGLGRLNDTTWSFWYESPFYYTTTIKHHKNGSLWVAPSWGFPLNLTSDTTWVEYDSLLVIPWSMNYQFAIDTNGVIWFGKYGSGVVAYNGATFNRLEIPFTEIQSSSVYSIYSDRNNNKWFGFGNGYIVKYTGDFPTTIKDDEFNIPIDFSLSQNFPNPFNPSTTISWQSPVSSHQSLKIFDILGNEVASLVNEFRNAGSYEVDFDASALSSGVYFYKLQAGDFLQTKKMILIK
jgi:ligand-binding sensor domain-containing protein